MRKVLNSLLLLAYPLFLATGLWISQRIGEEAAKVFHIPLAEFMILNLCFVVTFGLFAYYFLVEDKTFYIFTAALGTTLLLFFLCMGPLAVFSSSLYAAFSRGTHIFEAALALYGVLLIKERRKRKR